MVYRSLVTALWLCAAALPASAADYPNHAIKMIVPFAAGGGTDVLARIIAQNLNSKWGQPVVVENQPGASGAIGTRAVMKAPPDGYTLLMASTGALMAVSSGGDGAFDVNKVLAPIAIGAAPPYLLVVNPKLPVNSTADLIRLARERPEGLTFGSSGVGAASHLSAVLFGSDAGIKLLHIPYKGTGPAVTDLLGGRIDLMFAPGPVVQQFVQSGQLKALGVTDTQAIEILSGCSDRRRKRRAGLRIGRLVRPAGAGRARRRRSSSRSTRPSSPRWRPRNSAIIWRRSGAEPKPQTPEEFGRYINADVAKWSKLVKDNDVQLPGGK